MVRLHEISRPDLAKLRLHRDVSPVRHLHHLFCHRHIVIKILFGGIDHHRGKPGIHRCLNRLKRLGVV